MARRARPPRGSIEVAPRALHGGAARAALVLLVALTGAAPGFAAPQEALDPPAELGSPDPTDQPEPRAVEEEGDDRSAGPSEDAPDELGDAPPSPAPTPDEAEPADPEAEAETQGAAGAGVGDALPPPDEGGVDWGWVATGLGACGGCAVCGAAPCALAGAALLYAGALISIGAAEGGCGGAFAIVAGAVIAVLAMFPAAALGPLSALGGLGGAVAGAFSFDRSMLAPALGALPGLLVGLLAPASLGALFLVVPEESRAMTGLGEEVVLPILAVGMVATVLFALLAGPLAVGGALAADLAWALVDDGQKPAPTKARPRPERTAPTAMAY